MTSDATPARPPYLDGRRVVYGVTAPNGLHCLIWCGHMWSMRDAAQGPLHTSCPVCRHAEEGQIDDLELDWASQYLVPVRLGRRAWTAAKRASGTRFNRYVYDSVPGRPDPRFSDVLAWRAKQEKLARAAERAPEADVPMHLGAVPWPPAR